MISDAEAFTLAIEAARNEDQGRRDQIDDFLRTRPSPEVVRFASYSCQMRSLCLAPWMYPPALIDEGDIDRLIAGSDDVHGKRTAAQLLRRMLELGISKYHPDPMAAIAEAEARAKPSAA
jgi:hypothetical protein